MPTPRMPLLAALVVTLASLAAGFGARDANAAFMCTRYFGTPSGQFSGLNCPSATGYGTLVSGPNGQPGTTSATAKRLDNYINLQSGQSVCPPLRLFVYYYAPGLGSFIKKTSSACTGNLQLVVPSQYPSGTWVYVYSRCNLFHDNGQAFSRQAECHTPWTT